MFHGWRYTRFHVSYLIAWSALGLLAGIFVGQFATLGVHWLVVLIALFVLGISLRSRRWYACVLVIVVGVLFGMMRASDSMAQLRQTDAYIGSEIVLTGTISQDPVLTNGSNQWQVQLDGLEIKQRSLAGSVYATVVSDENLKRGDVLQVAGKAGTGFGTFRFSMYRAEVMHVVRPNDIFLAARDTFAEGTRRVIPEPEASLGLGFLVGQKSSLPDDLTEQLKTVGLTHIIVASGYNLTILVRFARRLLARRSRYLALSGSLLLVAGFVLTSGFSASMNRAAVVTILTLLAWYYGRKFHPVQLILYVAAMSALLNPSYLWGDLGWLLSFAAFTGVLVVAPIITKLLSKPDKKPGAFLRLLIETLSAEVMTLPIIIASFGYVPVLALIANILVAPIIPFAMFTTFIAGLAGLVGPWLTIVALPASILVAYVVATVTQLASPDWARFSLQLPLVWFVVWYLLCGIVVYVVWRKKHVDLLEVSVVE